MTAIGMQTLSQAVEMLREDLAIANSSLLSERVFYTDWRHSANAFFRRLDAAAGCG